eukprot:CAMPEP_0117435874 /NCGR_PEP_ID=MMETSP0759-20121206/712_1 /TAXON_ID=63605 /ORGANISM="Percolomonas cosmopolitus, Strain WS" /LENGTH=255 /DNA_ID=CAMNT_0005227447 /DNA_START=314 /DNA_END=1081 /DNA_ORIENTATION=+
MRGIAWFRAASRYSSTGAPPYNSLRSINRKTKPNSLGALDWYSEPSILAASKHAPNSTVGASIYHRSKVRIGSEAFLRKYPNDQLNFVARLYILLRYRWIEWIKRVEWWFVGGWGLIASIGLFGASETSSTPSLSRSANQTNAANHTPPQDDPTVATLHKIPHPSTKQRAQEDQVLSMLDAHFEQRMSASAPWIGKMDNYLRGDPREQVTLAPREDVGGGMMTAGGALPVMGQSARLPQMMGSGHMGGFRMRRMR